MTNLEVRPYPIYMVRKSGLKSHIRKNGFSKLLKPLLKYVNGAEGRT